MPFSRTSSATESATLFAPGNAILTRQFHALLLVREVVKDDLGCKRMKERNGSSQSCSFHDT